ncbi:SDR family NAD(P)-dependent oxidoreductase [Conexibacter sp. CPCC 206217]|uniref:SDR family NAD(P)-dependent oxidoreductase n=1 Tax=Conexibacter sp. CPCC 206217 TaxID=3064574 RepID=UPI00271A012D|nr:SDR family NAD(P)-dependent oxidoreductase [Conexibacter sp. CPCC 206217]MDO8212576.1 SDR family NAD(P)-dependent oxidoreductase [Conexibacter sp. CPCC 206217]
MTLAGQVALVTGAGRGIGRAIAERFLAAGATVVALDRDEDAAAAVGRGTDAASANGDGAGGARAALAATSARVLAIGADVGDAREVAAAMARVDRELGRLDALVNNAGIVAFRAVADMADEEWDSVLRVNLTGTFNTCREAARRFREQRSGAIVNVASVSASIGSHGRGAYSASKGGVLGLTRVLAAELGPVGARANAILPGTTETALANAALDEQLLAAFVDRTPAGRRGQPDEIAQAALFLASPAASYVNGVALPVDGGYLIGGLLVDERGRPR